MKNLLGLLSLLILTISIGCKDTTKVAEATTSVKTSAVEAAQKTAQIVKDESAVGEFKVTEAKVEAKEALVEAKESIAKVVEQPAAKVKAATQEVKSEMKEMADKVKAQPSKIAAQAKEVAQTQTAKASSSVAAAKETVQAKVQEKAAEVVKPATNDKIVAAPAKKVVTEKVEKVAKSKPAPMHEAFDGLLRKYVSNSGKVNYAGLKGDVATLDGYLAKLSGTSLAGMSKKEKLAFWINAYNAFTIKKILNNYPLGSITELDGGKPWDVKWINLDGQNLSLNNIENDIIRPTFKEPRIHFAVNCAAKSCPPILNKAWTAANLESNFEKQTKAFINSSNNTLTADKITISKIFDWYGVDFGDLEGFIRKYSNTPINKGATIAFNEYDWGLNN